MRRTTTTTRTVDAVELTRLDAGVQLAAGGLKVALAPPTGVGPWVGARGVARAVGEWELRGRCGRATLDVVPTASGRAQLLLSLDPPARRWSYAPDAVVAAQALGGTWHPTTSSVAAAVAPTRPGLVVGAEPAG